MSNTSGTTAPSGTGQKSASFTVEVDPATMAALTAQKAGDDQAAHDLMTSGPATHQIKLELSDLTWAEVHSRLGSTTFLDDYQATLHPADVKSPQQAEVHVEVIKQTWPDIHSVSLSTALGGQMQITDGSGNSYSMDVTQDVKFKSFTLEGTVTTDFSSGSPKMSGEVSLKIEW
jgi:hypothetical protein